MPAPPETTQDVHFPKAGLHAAGAYGRQPARRGRDGAWVRTAAEGRNVRSYDPVQGRDRGGSRAGLSRYVPAPLVAGWVVQCLGVLATTDRRNPLVQQSSSGRIVYLLAVSQGQVRVATPDAATWAVTANNTGESPPLNFSGVMQSSPCNQREYFVDGNNYVFFNPPTNAVEAWRPTKGQLPRDDQGNGARLICTWRGRLVLSGLLRDPQNWFMCRVGEPDDFGYAPSPATATDPVAGNNSQLGIIGDVVTALIPYTDDVLIFGGDHTLYAMRGDPANGGQVDLISDVTGVAFGRAWCKDPYGNVYFFGTRPGVWRMAGPSQPERISQPIEPLLQNVDTGRTIVRLVWDDRQQAVHLFLTPDDAPAAAVHYTWEFRSNSWWQDTFANNQLNPLCVAAYDGNDANDRVVLLGCWDGYVRFIDVSAVTDDGSPIASSVLLGPIMTQELDEMLLKEIQAVLGANAGAVTWEVLAGPTAELALAAAPRASGTFAADRGATQPVRVADHAIYVKLRSTNRWALESIRCVFGGRGKVRRRKP